MTQVKIYTKTQSVDFMFLYSGVCKMGALKQNIQTITNNRATGV